MNNSVNDKRLETLKHQLHDELVDEDGNPPDAQDVDGVVTSTREHLTGPPGENAMNLRRPCRGECASSARSPSSQAGRDVPSFVRASSGRLQR
jgi:hypothetical protein